VYLTEQLLADGETLLTSFRANISKHYKHALLVEPTKTVIVDSTSLEDLCDMEVSWVTQDVEGLEDLSFMRL
jgi:hypothetical protein